LEKVIDELWDHVQRIGEFGRTATLKVKFQNFQQITRSKTNASTFDSKPLLLETATGLLEGILPTDHGVRLLGVSVSGFRKGDEPQMQFDL
jgi:DNA polymerase-4